MGAATSSLLTGLFSETTPDETDAQRQAKRNLILSLVTGVAAATGGDAATATNAGTAAVDNNWLATQQIEQMNKELAAAETPLEQLQIVGKWGKTSIRQDAITSVGVVQGLTAGAWGDVKGVYEFLSAPVENLTALGQLISTPEMREKLGSDLYDKYMNQINSMMYSLQEGGDFEAFELGRNMGDLLWDISSTVVAVKGVAKGVAVLSKVSINAAVKTTELAENGIQILTKSEVATGKGASSANNVNSLGDSAANVNAALKLRTELAFKEAGILSADGTLTKQAILGSKIVGLAGGEIKNPAIIKQLTSDGSNISDWAKYTTGTVKTSNGQSLQIHYYMNQVTGKIDYVTKDFKVKGIVQP